MRFLLLHFALLIAAIGFLVAKKAAWARANLDCLLVAGALCVFSLRVLLPELVENLTIVTSVEEGKNVRSIRKTLALMRQHLCANHIQMLAQLRHGCLSDLVTDGKFDRDSLMQEFRASTHMEQKQIDEAFAELGTFSDTTTAGKLRRSLEAVKVAITEEQSEVLLHRIEAHPAEDLCLDDFRALQIAIKRWRTRPMDEKDLREIFREIGDSEGTVSAESLYKGFQQAGTTVGLQECQEIVEMVHLESGGDPWAEHGVGISLHQLEHWFKSLEHRLHAELLEEH